MACRNVLMSINQFFKYLWEIRRGTNKLKVLLSVVSPFLKVFLKTSTFYTITESFSESVRIYVGQALTGISLKVMAFLGSFLMVFIISSLWNSQIVNCYVL